MAIAANAMITTIAVSRDRRAVRRAAVALGTGATCSEVSLFESSHSGPVDIAPYITLFWAQFLVRLSGFVRMQTLADECPLLQILPG
jgi:hypothetical protein